MKSFLEQARFYAQYHQSKATLYTHLAGIPLILFSLMVLFGFVKLIIPGVMSTSLATIGTLALLAFYFRLNWRLSLILLPILILLLWLSSIISFAGPTRFALWVFFITFVVGWILQLTGHLIEGKKPAFMEGITQASIAPLYIVAEVCFMLGRMQSLSDQMHGDDKA